MTEVEEELKGTAGVGEGGVQIEWQTKKSAKHL
jgi:hypothetical protein